MKANIQCQKLADKATPDHNISELLSAANFKVMDMGAMDVKGELDFMTKKKLLTIIRTQGQLKKEKSNKQILKEHKLINYKFDDDFIESNEEVL